MSDVIDIKIIDLVLGFFLLAIPIFLFVYYRIGLVKDMLIGAARMVLQLSLVAFYLEWIFKENSAWINTLWVLMMVFVGVFTTIKRVSLHWKYFVIPFTIASLLSAIIIDAFFLGFVVKLDYFFDARYFIPITGMVLGNALNHNIVGLSTYFTSLSEKSELYLFLQTNTSSTKLALRPFIKEAVVRGLNPLIATMAVIGLISLPGMMTGQILGGSSPAVAIKYQIMIMLAIFVGCTINLFLSILFSNRFIFNDYGKLDLNMLKPKS